MYIFTPFWVNLMDDLQKTSCHNLKNEWNWVPSNVPEPLAYAHINLSAFGSMNIHFPSEKLILLDFSSPRGVTTLGCEFHSQAGLATTRGDSACQGRVSWCRCSWRIILKSDQLLVAPIVFSLAVLDNRWRYIIICTRVDKPASLLIRMLLGFVLTMYLSILLAVFLYKYIQIR